MSVGHSRRTSRKPSPHHSGASASASWRCALDAVLLERRGLAHVVGDVGEDLLDRDVEPVLGLAGELAHDDPLDRLASSITVGGVIQFCGL